MKTFTDWFGEEHYKENSSGDLENKCYEITELNKTLKKTFQKFKDQMATELWKARNEVLKKYEKESLYLDPDTAHTSLVLSEDQWSAWESHESPEEMPYHPERFENRQCVLGLNGYTSGRVYWEVDVEKAKEWHASSNGSDSVTESSVHESFTATKQQRIVRGQRNTN
uniref:butyrophilin subfamily 3 member A1-like n=1 Tax=Podarcis muralis TaxID=64176 RepID=UPI0010A0613D|nr:butyrophilin subfamily 3 member A1-like [Podarcis muralis]